MTFTFYKNERLQQVGLFYFTKNIDKYDSIVNNHKIISSNQKY